MKALDKALSKGVWTMIESTPGFNDRMRAVEARLKAGGGVLYEVRDGALRKVRRSGVKALDGRHRWEYLGLIDGRDVHTCRVCGVTQRFERIIPTVFYDAVLKWVATPNPYRALFR